MEFEFFDRENNLLETIEARTRREAINEFEKTLEGVTLDFVRETDYWDIKIHDESDITVYLRG